MTVSLAFPVILTRAFVYSHVKSGTNNLQLNMCKTATQNRQNKDLNDKW